MVEAALNWANQGLEGRMATALDDARPLVDVLLAVLPTDNQARVQWIVWGVFHERASRDPEVRNQVRALDEGWFDLVGRELSALARRGAIRLPGPAQLEAQGLVVFLDGLADRVAVDPEAWPRSRLRSVVECYTLRFAPEAGDGSR